MAVGSEVFLTDFPEYPASRAIFTVNKLINLDLIVIKINIMRIMFGNKIRKIKFELVRDHNIRIPEQKLVEGGVIFGRAVIFYDIVCVNFHEKIFAVLIFEACDCLKSVLVLAEFGVGFQFESIAFHLTASQVLRVWYKDNLIVSL